jgi:hypothetical protein
VAESLAVALESTCDLAVVAVDEAELPNSPSDYTWKEIGLPSLTRKMLPKFNKSSPEDSLEQMLTDTKKKSQSWVATVRSQTYRTIQVADYAVGEPIVEPEVDLSSFLEKQRISEPVNKEILSSQQESDEDDVDQSLAHLAPGKSSRTNNMKGKTVTVEWTEDLAAMEKQKNEADANRGTNATPVMI